MWVSCLVVFFFFFNDTAPTEIYTLSLHDALPISVDPALLLAAGIGPVVETALLDAAEDLVELLDRKSTRLNSSHSSISYAVFCLKKKIKAPIKHRSLTVKSVVPYSSRKTPRMTFR